MGGVSSLCFDGLGTWEAGWLRYPPELGVDMGGCDRPGTGDSRGDGDTTPTQFGKGGMKETGAEAAVAVLHEYGGTADKMRSRLERGIKERYGDEPVPLGKYQTERILTVEDPSNLGLEVLLGRGQRVVPGGIHGKRQEDDPENLLTLLARGVADQVATDCGESPDP